MPVFITDNTHGGAHACAHVYTRTHRNRERERGREGGREREVRKNQIEQYVLCSLVNTSDTTNDWTEKLLYISESLDIANIASNEQKKFPWRFIISGEYGICLF